MYLAAVSVRHTLDRRASPELWRRVRRFNRPVQLAVAASDDVARSARDASTAALLALAPCQPGSPELLAAARELAARPAGAREPLRVNPVHTLHAVDNLALSAASIGFKNRAYGLGLGGAPGQAFEALEVACERLAGGTESEAILLAGDQSDADTGTGVLGVAFLLAAEPVPFAGSQRRIEIRGVEWEPRAGAGADPHAARGLAALAGALAAYGPGAFRYLVRDADADGAHRVAVVGAVS